MDKRYFCRLPQVCVLLGILGGGELQDELDQVEGLVVHVVGVDLVAHRLRPTPADAEQHDSLRKWTVLTSMNSE